MQVPSRFGSMCCFATSFSVSGLQSSSSEICLSRLVSETEASAEASPAPAVAMCGLCRCPAPPGPTEWVLEGGAARGAGKAAQRGSVNAGRYSL